MGRQVYLGHLGKPLLSFFNGVDPSIAWSRSTSRALDTVKFGHASRNEEAFVRLIEATIIRSLVDSSGRESETGNIKVVASCVGIMDVNFTASIAHSMIGESAKIVNSPARGANGMIESRKYDWLNTYRVVYELSSYPIKKADCPYY